MTKTINQLIMEYFSSHPNEELEHGPVVDWVTNQWLEDHETPPRDPWRAIRKLHQEGKLIKVKKGVYKYNPEYSQVSEAEDFPQHVKDLILEKDEYRCVVCGRGRQEGVELVIDHIRPKDKGGTNDFENGQTLCMEHNLIKKNYSQTEAGKRYFIRIYEKAVKSNDERIIAFCKAVFDVYDSFAIDVQINRPDKD